MRHLIRSLMAAACLAGLALPAGARHVTLAPFEDPWPMAGGGSAHESVAEGPAPAYRTAWRAGIDAEPVAGPVVGQDILVIVARGEVIALDPESGRERWRVDRERGPAGAPALAGGLVLHVDGQGEETALVARRREDGAESWRSGLGSAVAGSIVLLEGKETVEVPNHAPAEVASWTALVGTREGALRAIAASDGAEVWSADLDGRIDGAPAVADGRVYVTTQDLEERTGRVLALDAETGEEAWGFAPEGNVAGFSAVTVAGGVAYAGTGDLSARAFDAETGERLWDRPTRAPFSAESMPAIAGDAVVFADVLGHVYLLDREMGEERWLYRVPGFLTRGAPVVVSGYIVIGDDSGRLSAIDLESGHLVWRRDLGEGSVGSIAADGDRVVAAPADGPVLALEHDPGAALLDEPSPTTLFLGTALLNYAAAFAAVLAGTLVVFRLLIRPKEE